MYQTGEWIFGEIKVMRSQHTSVDHFGVWRTVMVAAKRRAYNRIYLHIKLICILNRAEIDAKCRWRRNEKKRTKCALFVSVYGRMVEDRSSPIPIHILYEINKIVLLFFSSTLSIGSFQAARLLRIRRSKPRLAYSWLYIGAKALCLYYNDGMPLINTST